MVSRMLVIRIRSQLHEFWLLGGSAYELETACASPIPGIRLVETCLGYAQIRKFDGYTGFILGLVIAQGDGAIEG
jgi:hypothetical protein